MTLSQVCTTEKSQTSRGYSQREEHEQRHEHMRPFGETVRVASEMV